MNIEDQYVEKIYREAFPPIAKLLHGLGADLPTARDIFHDAMVIYLEKMRDHRLPPAVTPTQYLAGIARITWFKQCKERRSISDSTEMDDLVAEEPPADPEKKYRLLREQVQAAGASCMRLLQAFYYEGLSMRAIAEKFHYRSTHSATVQKYKCLEKLREKIKTTEYEEAVA
ncbi:MAG TPA: sigma-70 family RNA polymerase sigma factor [Puia sp.]|nr:sigma-70 family RNA polymerase sigma factor [Puia sp.]